MAKGKKKDQASKRKREESESKKIEISKPKKACTGNLGSLKDSTEEIGNVLPTRQATVDQLKVAIKQKQFCLIEGPIGCGKTYIAKHVGNDLKLPVKVMQLGDQIDSKSLFGSYQSTEVAGQFRYKCSNFTLWLKEPCLILLEDIDMANADVVAKVVDLTSSRKALLPSGDEVLFDDSVRIVATSSARGKRNNVLEGVPVRVFLNSLTEKELRRLIIDSYPRCAHLAKTLVSVFLAVQAVPAHANSRYLTSVDLLRACARLSSNTVDLSSNMEIFVEIVDCWCLSDPSKRSRILCEEVATCLNITGDQLSFHLLARQPSLSHDDYQVKIGRAVLPKVPSLKVVQKHRLGHTRDVLQLMERISVCVRYSEPVLLVGETGVGKTSVVQALASSLHIPLKVVNVSPTSDSDELIEGYKPTTLAYILEPFTKFYYDVFTSSYDKNKNEKFLSNLESCLSSGRYKDYLIVVEKTANKALMSKEQNDPRWAEVVVRARRIRQGLEKNAVPFTIMRGAVLEAIEEGNWLLIDEINLASPECLDAIVHAIASKSHPNFRLFACMNPATDAGKRRLPPSVRTKFNEFYVDEMNDPIQLGLVVSSYLPSMKHSVAETLVKFYLQSKEAYPNSYSLRTLCRALLFAADNLFGSTERSLFEAVCMAFLTNLNTGEKEQMKLTIRSTFKLQDNVPIPEPRKDSDRSYVNVMGYWIEQGTLFPKSDKNYVITKTVKENLAEIGRIVCSGRFPILLEGETSAGKTSIVCHLAKITGNNVVRINNHEHTDVQEYMGSYVADENGRLVFREGALVKAVRDGSWVILDELNLAPTDVIEALNRLLDDNRELFIPELNTTVQAHRRFRLFATQNPAGTYAGRKRLSRALLSRFVVIRFNHLPMDELSAMVCTRCEVHQSAATKMISVLTELRSQRSLSGLFSARDGLMTLRDVFRWAKRLSTDETSDDWLQILINHGYFLLAGRCRNKKDEQTVVETLEKVLKRTIDTSALFDKASPYFPSHLQYDRIVLTVGMRRMLVMTYQAWLRDEAVLMVGETGGGKTSLAQTLSGEKLLSINCHERTETADFLGRLRPKEGGGFEWSDGVVILAMRSGYPLLIDEISLAEDSVLERLNPLFEEERTLLLSDAGVDVQSVVSASGFQMIATMNPGGDYGKKELSKALRNRFTEVWSSNDYEKDELIAIFDMRIPSSLNITKPSSASRTIVLWIAEFFSKYVHVFRHSASVRDVVACADIFASCVEKSVSQLFAIHEALSAVFLDAIASQPTRMVVDVSAILDDAERILLRIVKQDSICKTSIVRSIVRGPSDVQIGPLSIPHGCLPVKLPKHFSLNAPTCISNFYRIARALLIDKPILLEGSPGCGKSSTVMALAELTGHPITRLNLSDQTDLTDLFGSDIPIVTDDGTISFKWEDGPVLRAIKKGEWILLDEMNLASQSVLEGLNACFDHRKVLFIAELNKSFEIPTGNGCRFFACQNPRAQGGNRRALPKSFVNRFTNIWVDDLTVEDIVFILKEIDVDNVLTDQQIHSMVEINKRLSDDTTLVGGPYSFNLRDLLRWLDYYSSKKSMAAAYDLLYVSRMRLDIDRQKLRELYEEVFQIPYSILPIAATVGSDLIKIGEACLPRISVKSSSSFLLSSQLTLLSQVANCVEHNWLTLLVGPKNSGKRSTVQTLADLCGVGLVTLTLNSETDAQELIGSYEQVIDTEALSSGKKKIVENLQTILSGEKLEAIVNAEDLLSLEIAVESVIKLIDGHAGLIQECREFLEIASRSDMRFAWIDSVFVKAFLEGHWILIEDVNLCSAAVLDRLNSCLETGGKLVISERQSSYEALEAHQNFRVFLSMDHKNGDISRAMRNRSVEIFMQPEQMWNTSANDIISLCPETPLLPFRLDTLPFSQAFPQEFATTLCSASPENLLHFFILLSEFSFETAAQSLGLQLDDSYSLASYFKSIPVSDLTSERASNWFLTSWLNRKGTVPDKFLHCFLSCSPSVIFCETVEKSFGERVVPFIKNIREMLKDSSNVPHAIDPRYHCYETVVEEDENLKRYITSVILEWCQYCLSEIPMSPQSAEHNSRTMSKYEMKTMFASFQSLPLVASLIDQLLKTLKERTVGGEINNIFLFCISLSLFVGSVRATIMSRSGIAPIYIAWNDFCSHLHQTSVGGIHKFVELFEKGWSSEEHNRFLKSFLILYNNYRFSDPFPDQDIHDRFLTCVESLRFVNEEEIMENQDEDNVPKKESRLSIISSEVNRMHSLLKFLCSHKYDEKEFLFASQKIFDNVIWHSPEAEQSVRYTDLIISDFSEEQRVLEISRVGCFAMLYTRLWQILGFDVNLQGLTVEDLQKFSIPKMINELWKLGPSSHVISEKIEKEIVRVVQSESGWYSNGERTSFSWRTAVDSAKALLNMSLPPSSSLDPVVFKEENHSYLTRKLAIVEQQIQLVMEQLESSSRQKISTLPIHHPVLQALNEEKFRLLEELKQETECDAAYRPEAEQYFELCSHLRAFLSVCNVILQEVERVIALEELGSIDDKKANLTTSTFISFVMSADNFKKVTWQKYSAYPDVFVSFVQGVNLLLLTIHDILSIMSSVMRRKELVSTTAFPPMFKMNRTNYGLESSELQAWAIRDSSPMPIALKSAIAKKKLENKDESEVTLLWVKKQWQKWYEKNIAKAAEKDFMYRNKSEEEKDLLDVEEFFAYMENDKEIIAHNDLLLLAGLGLETLNDKSILESAEINYKLALTWLQQVVMDIGAYKKNVHNASAVSDLLTLKWILTLESTKEQDDVDVYRSVSLKEVRRATEILKGLEVRTTEVRDRWPEVIPLKEIVERITNFSSVSLATSQTKMAQMVETIIEISEEWQKIADRENSLECALSPVRELLVDWKKMEVRHWSQLLTRFEDEARLKTFLSSYPLFDALFQADTPEALHNLIPMAVEWIQNSTILDFETRVKNVRVLSKWAELLGHSNVNFKLNSISSHFSQYLPRINEQLLNIRNPADQSLQDYVKIVKYNDLNLWSIKVSSKKAQAQLYKIIRRFKEALNIQASVHFDKLVELKENSSDSDEIIFDEVSTNDKLVLRANSLAKTISDNATMLCNIDKFVEFTASVTSCDENLRVMINYDQYEDDKQKEKAQGYARNGRQREVALLIKDAQSLGFTARKAVSLNTEAITQTSVSGLLVDGDLESSVRACAAGRSVCIRLGLKPSDQISVSTRNHVLGMIEYGMSWMTQLYNTLGSWSQSLSTLKLNLSGLEQSCNNSKNDWIIDHELTNNCCSKLVNLINEVETIVQGWKHWMELTPESENEEIEDYYPDLARLRKSQDVFGSLQSHVLNTVGIVEGLKGLAKTMVAERGNAIFSEKIHVPLLQSFTLVQKELESSLDPLLKYFGDEVSVVRNKISEMSSNIKVIPVEMSTYSSSFDPALLFIQNLYKKVVDIQNAKDMKEMEKFDLAYKAISSGNLEQVLAWIDKVVSELISGSYPDQLDNMILIIRIAIKLMESFNIVLHNVLDHFSRGYYALLSMAMQLLEKGYINTIPKEGKQESGNGETDEAGEGGGMGEGKSSNDAKDVTEEMEESGQIEGLQDEEQEPPSGEKGSNETPIEMEEDFAEDLQDIDKNEKGNENEEDDDKEDEEPEAEDQLGEVEEPEENKLDPKLWDDEEKEQEQNKDMDQDDAGADDKNNQLAAKEDDPMAANEKEQPEAKDDQNEEANEEEPVDDQENVDERERENQGEDPEDLEQDRGGDDVQEEMNMDKIDEEEDGADEETETHEQLDDDDKENEEDQTEDKEDVPQATEEEEEAERKDHIEAFQQGDGGDKQDDNEELDGKGADDEEDKEKDEEDDGEGKSCDNKKGKDGAGVEKIEEEKDTKEEDEDQNEGNVEKEKKLATDDDMETTEGPEGEGEEHDLGKQVEGTPSGTKESLGAGSLDEAKESKKDETSEEMDVCNDNAIEESESSIHLAATDLYQLAEGLTKDLILEDRENDTKSEEPEKDAENRSVSLLSAELAENLRLILEPQRANKMQGDYRTGKRLNMRRLIPYIASDYRKDRIWMRRTKRAQREYQILIAVDDSASMNENGIHQVTCESVCAIDDALRRCDAGAVSVISFGSQIKAICSFGDSMISGPDFIQKLTFDQSSTDLIGLLDYSKQKLADVRTPNSEQLLIIVSDGRGALSQGAEKIKRLVSSLQGVTVLFVILDSGTKSITELSVASFQAGSVILTPYLQLFPFPFYVIIKSIQQLPSVLSESIRQWCMDINKTTGHSYDVVTSPNRKIGHGFSSLSNIPDGFGSPNTAAQTPLGVITKTDSRIAKTNHVVSGEKYLCINCRSGDNCICKECVRNKLKFYSRKESISRQKKLKQSLDSKITVQLQTYHDILGETNQVKARIQKLHEDIQYAKERKKKNELLIKSTTEQNVQSIQLSKQLEAKFGEHDKKYEADQEKLKKKRNDLNGKLKKIWQLQAKKSMAVLTQFPIQKLLAEVHPLVQTSSNMHKWTLVSGVPIDSGMFYAIGHAKLNEAARERLACYPSVLNIPSELRPTFAAILHIVQILSMLTMLFEFSLPNSISYREIATRDITSRESFHNDWNTICELSMCLGLHLGLPHEQVNFNDPVSNLLEIAKLLYTFKERRPSNVENKNRHYQIRTTSSRLHLREQEMKDWDVLDISEVDDAN
ncbi:unnamed protein product [Auanema sp. JU1783]|nr:unnamed protein product [Auanema sp. JU1783]